jgi:hypothetical protein
MDDPNANVNKKLDEVIGTEYDAGAKGLAAKLRAGIVRWIVAAVLALAMVAVIVATIESHRLPPPQGRKIPAKPVVIQIIPPQ